MPVQRITTNNSGLGPAAIGFMVGIVAMAGLSIGLQSFASQHTKTTSSNPFQTIPPDVITMIEAAEVAFMSRDADAIGQYLTEDFTWYRVNEDGANAAVSGREQTVAMLSTFFGNDSWTESEVHRLGMLGNILVQVEVDTFVRDGQPVELSTLSVYEFRDGMRWREWKFYPVADNPF